MTYRELADALGMTPDSARIKAKRRKWTIIPGNYPGAPVLVEVPSVELDRGRSPASAPERPLGSAPPDPPSAPSPAPLPTLDVLAALLERLAGVEQARERELAELRGQLEAERAKTAEADGRARELAGALAEVRAERDELRGQVERLTAGRIEDAAVVAGLRAEVEVARRRWWHVLVRRR